MNNTYLVVYIVPDLISNMNLAPGFKSPDASKMDYHNYVKYIEERFPSEVPVMFGMHANAEVGYLTSKGIAIFTTIQDIQGGKWGW